MLVSSGFGRKQTLRSRILNLHCQTETSMSRNKQEIHGLDSFIIPLFIEIQRDASVVFLAGVNITAVLCTINWVFLMENF